MGELQFKKMKKTLDLNTGLKTCVISKGNISNFELIGIMMEKTGAGRLHPS